MATPWRSKKEREEFMKTKACIDCESCFHKEVCSYYKASNGHIVLCEHWCNDVVEVRHGEWIKNDNERTCPHCGYSYIVCGVSDEKYCSNCGAKMINGGK